jgi:hypothetical protein
MAHYLWLFILRTFELAPEYIHVYVIVDLKDMFKKITIFFKLEQSMVT